MKLNDPVTFTIHTDSKAGWVTYVSPNGKTVEVEYAHQTLLNGPNSGEPDALQFTAGASWDIHLESNAGRLKRMCILPKRSLL